MKVALWRPLAVPNKTTQRYAAKRLLPPLCTAEEAREQQQPQRRDEPNYASPGGGTQLQHLVVAAFEVPEPDHVKRIFDLFMSGEEDGRRGGDATYRDRRLGQQPRLRPLPRQLASRNAGQILWNSSLL